MNVETLQLDALYSPRALPRIANRDAPDASFDSFDHILDDAKRAQQAREAAGQMVASAFIQPALAQLRESPFVSDRFAPGAAERRFGPLLDQHIADRVVSAGNFPLVDRLTEHLLSAGAGSPAGAVAAIGGARNDV
jgi:hypothetical protein